MRHPPRATSVLMLACCLAACSASGPPQGQTPFQPSPAMTAVLQERLNMRAVDPSTVTIARAREVPNLIDAMHAIPNVNGNPADSPDVPVVRPLTASGADGPLPALLYQPATAKNTPLVIYFPSGTWVTGGTDQYDETARQLARRSGWVVVSLGPRHAPEVTFPAIHDDAFAAYQWARAHAREWGADPTRVVLAGEGPGANLALSTALLARDRRAPVPNHLLLITPLAGTTLSGPSMAENGRSLPLTRRTIGWAQQRYTTDDRQLLDPRIDLQDRTDLAGMPPTTVVLAEIDPTRSGGEAVAAHLSAAGVPTDVRLFPGTTSDFFGLGEKVPDAAAAEDYAVHRLQAAFVRPVPSASPVRRPTRRHRLHRVRNLHEGS
jgi:acetyl esterase